MKHVVRINITVEVPTAMPTEQFDDVVKEMVAVLRHEPDIELASLSHSHRPVAPAWEATLAGLVEDIKEDN